MNSLRRALLFGIFFAVPSTQALAASLDVYATNVSNLAYVQSAPYLAWSASSITYSATNNVWVSADQLLMIVTDQQYAPGGTAWHIEVFTDNRHRYMLANSTFSLPDTTLNHSGGTVQGNYVSSYNGHQSAVSISTIGYPSGDPYTVSGGLISADGSSRVPLIWRIYNCPPDSSDPENSDPCSLGRTPNLWPGQMHENPAPNGRCTNSNGSSYTFYSPFCPNDWFFLQDTADVYLSGDNAGQFVFTPGNPVKTNWYETPLSNYGGEYVVCPYGTLATTGWDPGCSENPAGCCGPWSPHYISGKATQYLYVEANFSNATRQVYSTTIFVQLFLN
jgi:hypothetical protein